MNNPKKVEFTKRQPGPIPVIVGNRPQGKVHRTQVRTGDTVALRIAAESVLVSDVKVLGSEKFSGRIHGFEPSHPLNYGGHNIDDTVDFEHSHIFTLHLPRE